jgi:hypothetical protein
MDVCKPCGHQVWGEKMFAAIVGNMESARDSGDLYQGSVTDSVSEIKEKSQSASRNEFSNSVESHQKSFTSQHSSSSLFEEAIQTSESISQQQSQEAQNLLDSQSQVQQQVPKLPESSDETLSSDSEIISL